jgi:DNA-binding HxlR family transcriptional regulator
VPQEGSRKCRSSLGDTKTGSLMGRRSAEKAPDPMSRALDIVASKWTSPILYFLNKAAGPVRFRELQRTIGEVTQKELTKRLRELERLGLVSRQVFPEVPPRVEYRITKLGLSLVPPLAGLACWAEKYGQVLEDNQRAYDSAKPIHPPLRRTVA